MPEIIYKVFVSSTYEDLREERSELQKALLKLKCLPIGMELFPSADEETWDFITKQIDDSDYYVLIIAGRYGSEATDGISFTEKEYDYARKTGKRVIAFVHADIKNIPSGKIDLDPTKRQKLHNFIAKVKKSPVNNYTNPHELAMHAIASFVDLRERYPAIGFIRTDQSADQRRHIELLEKNARLKEQLAAALSKSGDEFRGARYKTSIIFSFSYFGINQTAEITKTWMDIFLLSANYIVDGITDEDFIGSRLCSAFLDKMFQIKDVTAMYFNIVPIRRYLYGQRLIDIDMRTEEITRSRHWLLTEYGKQQYGLLMANA